MGGWGLEGGGEGGRGKWFRWEGTGETTPVRKAATFLLPRTTYSQLLPA